MSTLSPSLQFDFKSINNNVINDKSGNLFNGTVNGGCKIVSDPLMGFCMQFDGSTGFITLPSLPAYGSTDFSGGITISTWVNFSAFNTFACILNFGQQGGANNITFQSTNQNNGILYYNHLDPSNNQSSFYLPTANTLSLNTWTHMAVTIDGSGNGVFYVNGLNVGTTGSPNPSLLPPKNIGTFNNFIGASNWSTSQVQLFSGKLAWLSVYNQALTQGQVNADMLLGEQNRQANFRKSFPVDFKVYSNNDGSYVPVLFLENQGKGKNLHLEISNNSSQSLNIPQATGNASLSNYHFQLHFRPGVLSDNFLKNNAITIINWSISVETNTLTGITYISFLRTGATLSLNSGSNHLIILNAVNANAIGGARNTNVEFIYSNLTLGSQTNTIEGKRMQNLSIVSHVGQKNIPLHADIVGFPSILNDGQTANQLIVRVVNTSGSAIPLSTSNQNQTNFIIAAQGEPAGELAEWALAEIGNLENVQVVTNVVGTTQQTNNSTTIQLAEPLVTALNANQSLNVTPPSGQSFSVTLTQACLAGTNSIAVYNPVQIAAGSLLSVPPPGCAWKSSKPQFETTDVSWCFSNIAQTEIAPGDSIDFYMTGIVSGLLSGQAIIKVLYGNIPGYWDGEFIIKIQKSPISVGNGGVGIGNTEPMGLLDIYAITDESKYMIGSKGVAVNNVFTNEGLVFNSTKGSFLFREAAFGAVPGKHETDLMLFYILNGTTANAVTDYSQNQYNGTVQGNATINNDNVMGQYMSFDGSSTSISPPAMTVDMSQGITVCCWIQLSSANQIPNYNIFSSQLSDGTNSYYFSLQVWTNGTGATSMAQLQITSTTDPFNYYIWSQLTTGEWTHLALTFGDQSANCWPILYINGVETNTNSFSQGTYYPASGSLLNCTQFTFLLGNTLNIPGWAGDSENNFFDGNIANIKIFNAILAPADVSREMNSTSPNPVSYIAAKDIMELDSEGNLVLPKGKIALGINSAASNAFLNLPYPSGVGNNGVVIGDASACESHYGGLTVAVPGGEVTWPLVILNNTGGNLFTVDNVGNIATYGGNNASGNLTLNGNISAGGNISGNGNIILANSGSCVGIGTNSPQASLHVQNFISSSFLNTNPYSWLNASGAVSSNQVTSENVNLSIYASGRIICPEFDAASDCRIKTVKGLSETATDMETLLRLEITDYQYIDMVANGQKFKKGLIAQQVEKIFPQAVNHSTDFIPDIYLMATEFSLNEAKTELTVVIEKEHELKVGDLLKLITNAGEVQKRVCAVPNARTFVISSWTERTETLFVFGKQVTDFRTVDYNHVSMLGISAIQQLHKEVAELKAENKWLKEQLVQHQQRTQNELEQIKRMIMIQN